MDAQANAALVLETFSAFNAGDLDSCLARMTPDFVMHYAELPEPLHGTETCARDAPGRLPPRRVQNFPATGRTIQYVSHEFYRVSDGLVAEEWICSDTASLLRQLS
jgi:ketosteroid isomerase-like protein